MRIIVDTNVVVSGLLWRGSPSVLMDLGLNAAVEFFTSEKLLKELAATLGKNSIKPQLERQRLTAAGIVSDYRHMCVLVEPTPIQNIAPDPDDDWVIATALAAEADLIVTGDKPFLGVGAVGNLQIVGVAAALEIIGGG